MSEGTIVERLRFDAIRCELNFSKGVATNMEEAADEIERLKADLKRATERDSGGYAPDGKTWKQAVFDEAAKRAEAERLLSEAWEKAAGIARHIAIKAQQRAATHTSMASQQSAYDKMETAFEVEAAIRAALAKGDE